MFFSRRAREAVLKNMKTVDGAHEAPASSNPNTAFASVIRGRLLSAEVLGARTEEHDCYASKDGS